MSPCRLNPVIEGAVGFYQQHDKNSPRDQYFNIQYSDTQKTTSYGKMATKLNQPARPQSHSPLRMMNHSGRGQSSLDDEGYLVTTTLDEDQRRFQV